MSHTYSLVITHRLEVLGSSSEQYLGFPQPLFQQLSHLPSRPHDYEVFRYAMKIPNSHLGVVTSYELREIMTCQRGVY